MLQYYRILLIAIFIIRAGNSNAQITLVNGASGDDIFPLVANDMAAVYYDNKEPEVVKRTAGLFVDDIYRITGRKMIASGEVGVLPKNIVVVGTIGYSDLINNLIKENKLNVDDIRSGWEQYVVSLVKNPLPGIDKALVIAGCDRRGAAYGLLSVSELVGVSPWYWWADVPVQNKTSLLLKINPFTSVQPSVKYRGIFINDEDWGLKPWAAKTFEPELNDIGPKTYAKICELLLRLKANYLSPAMHSCSGAFNKYDENKLVADSFGIVMGSIHCEPLLFNNATEWDSKTMGPWDYIKNKHGINKVLTRRVQENGTFENVYTLALRGIHDAVMSGNLTLKEQVKVLGDALKDQRKILSDVLKKPLEEVPQVFYPYKEVLDIYDAGLEVPDDVTLIWTDDDYGYMKRLSNSKEQKRKGRAGVYYHVSYWGPPNDNLWLCTTPPALMYQELKKAYETTADQLWVVNVGDIKPAEYHISLFMEMAFDINKFNSKNIIDHHADFLSEIYGSAYQPCFKKSQLLTIN
ncbi:glycosyl hydrolase 115 family protein [Niabella ginsengisoli]|uniref:Glycosyl hydrolase 115 family protein n=1 Tax=Niabella ginsengisoli TaxID=522298 RepID=A0ABS9SI08_9BACT|nr:glycosyl hydrolase 115 family protein [Niabella ginsengisoli]MCH5598012.1 glycosyl hydrolase 115 family protein [Niabella ginsengisoli]